MMKEKTVFQLKDVIDNPVKIQESLFQFVNHNASTYGGVKNFNLFLNNPTVLKPMVSYQYDPDFIFGVDTSFTQERMFQFLLGNEEPIFYNEDTFNRFVEEHVEEAFYTRYAYKGSDQNQYLEMDQSLAKALFKRCLLNYINHFYLTFTFSEDDQSQQLENDKIIEILKESDGIYLPYTKEMFDAIDVNPLLLDRELFIYEDGFIYQGDDAYQIHEELKKYIPSLNDVEDYTITYKGNLSEEALKKLYAIQKKVIVSESWIIIHGYLNEKTIKELDTYGVTFTLQENGKILLEVGETGGQSIKELYSALKEAHEKGKHYYQCVSDCIYNGALARLGRIHTQEEVITLTLGKTSFMTHLGLKDPRVSLYPEWKYSYFNEEECNLLKQMDLNEELNVQALVVRLESEDHELENYCNRRIEALNDYLSRSMSIHRVSVAGNLVTSDGYLLYENAYPKTGVSVYGASEIYDEQVSYYHNRTDRMVPSIYQNFDLFRNYNREFSRHVLLKYHMDVSDVDWKYYGLSVNGYQGSSSEHISPIQFHVLAEHPLKETFLELQKEKPSLKGLKYYVDDTKETLSLSRIISLLLVLLMLVLVCWNIYWGILNSFKDSQFILSNIVVLLVVSGYLFYEKVYKEKKSPKALSTEKQHISSKSIMFEVAKNKEDTLLELLQNLYLLNVLKSSKTIQKEIELSSKQIEDLNYMEWKNKVRSNKRNARKASNKS